MDFKLCREDNGVCNFFLAVFNGFSVTTLLHFVVSIKRQLFVSCYSFGYEGLNVIRNLIRNEWRLKKLLTHRHPSIEMTTMDTQVPQHQKYENDEHAGTPT